MSQKQCGNCAFFRENHSSPDKSSGFCLANHSSQETALNTLADGICKDWVPLDWRELDPSN